LRVDEITVLDDSVLIELPFFDSEIRARIGKGTLTGKWVKHLAERDAEMDFKAVLGSSWRFFNANTKKSPKQDISGRWSVTFTSLDNTDTTIAVGEFSQENGRVLGTFITSTGDFRFLEGTISDNSLYLSSFDGGSAYLFTGNLLNDSTLVDGKFYSGYSSVTKWVARKDAKAILPDAYSLTALKKG